MIVLHIGLPKTGTTAFQVALLKHKGTLRRFGVDVPIDELTEAHAIASRFLPATFLDRPDIQDQLSRPLPNWSERHDRERCSIISSEYFWHCPPQALRNHFQAIDPDVRIALIVRTQGNLRLSGYGQGVSYVKIANQFRRLSYETRNDFAKLYSAHASVFGPDAMICEWYENLIKARTSLLSFVLQQVGCDVGVDDAELSAALNDHTTHNPSSPNEILDLLRFCNDANLPRCKALLMSGAIRFPSKFATRRALIADTIAAAHIRSNREFSRLAAVELPPEALRPAPWRFKFSRPSWPPRLEGYETIYTLLRGLETQLDAVSPPPHSVHPHGAQPLTLAVEPTLD